MAQSREKFAETLVLHNMFDFQYSCLKFPVSRLLVYLIYKYKTKSVHTQVYYYDWLAPVKIVQSNYPDNSLGIIFCARGSFTALFGCHILYIHYFHQNHQESFSSANVYSFFCHYTFYRWWEKGEPANLDKEPNQPYFQDNTGFLIFGSWTHIYLYYDTCALPFTKCISCKWSTLIKDNTFVKKITSIIN